MKLRLTFLRRLLLPHRWIAISIWTIVLSMLAAQRAAAQAVGAATAPMVDVDPQDQPLPGQQLGTTLTLNQGVEAINAENQSIERYAVNFQFKTGAQTNFFGTETNQKTAAFTDFSGDLSLVLRNNRARFFALYQPEYDVYPQYTSINNFQQRYFQGLGYKSSTRSSFSWDTTAGRLLSINQYLPLTLGIGGIGVVVPTLQTQLLENSYEVSNVATVLGWRYLMSTRSTLTASLTSSWFLIVPDYVSKGSDLTGERFMVSGADLKYLYQVSMRDSIGVEVTPVYIYGLTPTGHNVEETVQALYLHQLGATWSAQVAAGPLFIQSSGPAFGTERDTSYAVNASLTHLIRKSQLSATYQRGFIVGFLDPAQATHQFGFSSHSPIRRNWVVTSSLTYVREIASGAGATSGHIYGGSAQAAYRITDSLQFFAQVSRLSQSFNLGAPTPYAFTQNQFGAGIRVNLGNRSARGGLQ